MSSDLPSFHEVLFSLLSSNYDSKSTQSEGYAKQLLKVHWEFVARNGKLTGLLEDYINQRKEKVATNNFLKKFIFWFFIALLGALTISVSIFFVCNTNSQTISSMVSVLSVSFTYLGSLIAVFKIMFEYLFPLDEEKDTISMIQAVINNDIKVEEIMSKAIDKNHGEVFERLKAIKQLKDEEILTKEEFSQIKSTLIQRLTEFK